MFPAFRIGFGTDTHRLQVGIPFYLGGIQIEHSKGAVGHSDADALLHAICDALLGAACLRDIGFHFPDTNPDFKGADSKLLLKKVNELISQQGFKIANIDCTIQLQKPKLKDYIPQMQESISSILGLEKNQVSIKAKTGEGLGYVGNEEGVDVQVVALVYKT